MAFTFRRCMQDYTTVQNFGTARLWREMAASPQCSSELIAQHLNKMLLVNPSEPTSAETAAIVLNCMYGDTSGMLPQTQINEVFEWVKASMRNLCVMHSIHILRLQPRRPPP